MYKTWTIRVPAVLSSSPCAHQSPLQLLRHSPLPPALPPSSAPTRSCSCSCACFRVSG